jgi:urocanate hydratase
MVYPEEAWARNENALFAIKREMERTPGLKVTIPNRADEELIEIIFRDEA